MKCEGCDLVEQLESEDEIKRKLKDKNYKFIVKEVKCDTCENKIEVPTFIKKKEALNET